MKRVGPDWAKQLAVDRLLAERLAPAAGVGPGQFALGRHLALEALGVDLDAGLGRHLHGELDGKAVGVVQPEGRRRPTPGPSRRAAPPRGSTEPASRVRRNAPSSRSTVSWMRSSSRDEHGVGAAEHVGHRGDEARRDGLDHAQLEGPAHGPADDAAQDVAPALVGRA